MAGRASPVVAALVLSEFLKSVLGRSSLPVRPCPLHKLVDVAVTRGCSPGSPAGLPHSSRTGSCHTSACCRLGRQAADGLKRPFRGSFHSRDLQQMILFSCIFRML